MRTRIVLILLAAIAISAGGCGKKEEEAAPVSTKPINNSAPEAATAGVAPSDPSIQFPGGAMKAGKAAKGMPGR